MFFTSTHYFRYDRALKPTLAQKDKQYMHPHAHQFLWPQNANKHAKVNGSSSNRVQKESQNKMNTTYQGRSEVFMDSVLLTSRLFGEKIPHVY